MVNRYHHVRRAVFMATVGTGMIVAMGWALEVWWLGQNIEASYTRVERSVETTFDRLVTALQETALAVAENPEIAQNLGRPDALSRLFEITRAAREMQVDVDISVTVYDGSGAARAWAGRPSEIPGERVLGERTFFVATGPLGLRVIYVEPLVLADDEVTESRRVGTVVAERVLSPSGAVTLGRGDAYQLSTSIADVSLRTAYEDVGSGPGPYSFELRSPSGDLLLEAEVLATDLDGARVTWRRRLRSVVAGFLAFWVLVSTAPLLVRPRRGTAAGRIVVFALSSAVGCLAAFGLLRAAIGWGEPWDSSAAFDSGAYQSLVAPTLVRHAADLLLLYLLVLGLGLVAAFLVDQARLGGRLTRQRPGSLFDTRFLFGHLLGGVAMAALVFGFDALVQDAFNGTTLDLLHTSLQPWDSARAALLAGLLLASVATLWGGVVVLVGAGLPWSLNHRDVTSALLLAAIWMVPGLALCATGVVPATVYPTVMVGSVAAAMAVPFARPWFRHASHSARVVAIFGAMLAPALLAYPTLLFYGGQSKQRFVETQYAGQAATQPAQLQTLLNTALRQIDEIAELQAMVTMDVGSTPTLNTDRAFLLWRQTDLARLRATSSVELYDSSGRLLSRFALNFPEYLSVPSEREVDRCGWEVFGEIAPFGSDERRVLHAERAICPAGAGRDDGGSSDAPAGSVVVHATLDYRALPFIASENPYTELLRPTGRPRQRGQAGQDVDLVIYGWSREPLFSSGQDAWSFDEPLFQRIYASRDPFWTTLSKGGRAYTTYVVNNRGGIYVLGYPVFGAFDHLVHLAELSTLIGVVFVLMAAVVGLGSWLTPDRYRFGRALFLEVRTSFYRRLLLAFIAVTLVPVLALAFAIRNYVTAQLRADVEAGAARTAAVAQRVIEESFVLQQVGEEATALINDDLLVWISQVLDQDINIFNGSQLVATSERDLFASGLLPTRTPAAVYSAIVLERMPSYVVEDSVGTLQYLMAATPIRAAGQDAVLTVPLASRQQEIERQIEDLDRGLLLGVALVVLLGAGSGLYMAERIADPVKRLTRATGRIARGDFDAQVVVRSADELQRLVASFNRMAVDLKDQQQQLERTHRLEAWADMTRQVAHEIKNPLTPVQLSAEHLLRVHADRGEPLGPVVKTCVESILTQVRLLRQISSEFSSYGSSPTVERRATVLGELVTSVLEPYLVGLQDRIDVSIDVPTTLPELSLDRTLVGRALTNVVENALHAMPGTGALCIQGSYDGAIVVLTVSDTGVGVDQDALQRIFEPYFSTKRSGTGLGMAIAKRNVELNDGTIAVDSRKGEGTTVTLTFVVDHAPAEPPLTS